MNNRLFFKNLGLFILPILLVLVGVEWRLRYAPNSYAFKKELIEKRANEIQVLVFGTSHAYYDFNPEEFSVPGINLANTSQSLTLDAQLLEKYLPALPQLKAVVVNISYFSFEYRLYGNADDYREFLYTRVFDIPGDGGRRSKFDLRRFSLLANFGQDLTKSILLYGFGQSVDKEINASGWFDSSRSGYPTQEITEEAGTARAKYHTSTLQPEMSARNIAAIHAIINLCSERGIKVILTQAPAFSTYTEHLDTAAEDRLRANVDSTGLELHDFLRDDRFTKEDFYNNDHLNSNGAAKFSKIFDEEVLCTEIKCEED